MLSTQDDLIEKLGLEKGRIEELVEEYGSLTEAIKAAAIESLQASERDLRGGLNAQENELLSKAKASGPASKSMNHIKTVNNITNNSRPIEVQIGDTIIHGADQSTVEKHIKVTRDMVNQIGRLIGIGR